LLTVARARVRRHEGAEGILAAVALLVDEARKEMPSHAQMDAIGIGFGGPLDHARRRVIQSYHVEGWTDFPIGDWAENRWRVPVSVDNDCATAALAEARLGAGRGSARFFYMTLGTGVGGALVTNGKVDHGIGFGAGEIGHTYVPDPDGRDVLQLEEVAAGWAIAKRTSDNAEQLYADAANGGQQALRLLDQITDSLSIAICNVVALLHPQRIVIGGGMSMMGALLWEPLRAKVKARAFAPFAGGLELVPAALGEEVVVRGALLLAGEHEKRRSQ
jgi:glucokinase